MAHSFYFAPGVASAFACVCVCVFLLGAVGEVEGPMEVGPVDPNTEKGGWGGGG